jgi:hypothetical protein
MSLIAPADFSAWNAQTGEREKEKLQPTNMKA